MFNNFKEYNDFDDFIKSWNMTNNEWIEYEKKLKTPKL